MHLVLSAADSKDALVRESQGSFSTKPRELLPGLFGCEAQNELDRLPRLAFARQVLPNARAVNASSISTWANLLLEALAGVLPEHAPWSLHVFPFVEVLAESRMGARAWHSQARARQPIAQPAERAAGVGPSRCKLIREATLELLAKKRRHLARYVRPNEGPFVEAESLVQLLLTSPEQGFLSIAAAPLPFTERHSISCFVGGELTPAVDKQAPSRAFAKLVEAESRMGRKIAARETCVDLGAAPGSWTYVAVRRGARVTSVDRAELRPDLMRHANVRFQCGDAFRYEPAAPVDWLLCDVIASAERSAELLLRWLRQRWCRQFVLTLKVEDDGSVGVLDALKRELPALTSELWLLRLQANKKEVCAFGSGA